MGKMYIFNVFNIICTVYNVEINLRSQHYMRWNIHRTDAQNLFLYVSPLLGVPSSGILHYS